MLGRTGSFLTSLQGAFPAPLQASLLIWSVNLYRERAASALDRLQARAQGQRPARLPLARAVSRTHAKGSARRQNCGTWT